MAITEWTYGMAVKTIAQMVGHPVPSSVQLSTDPAVKQMGLAVNHADGELFGMREWQDLTEAGTISVVADFAGQKEKGFALPADFSRFVDQTQWSPQSFLPAPGPISPQGWQQALIQSLVPAMYLYWQMRQDQIWFLAPPFPIPVNFNFYYISRHGVIEHGNTVPPIVYSNIAVYDDDTFKLDGYLITLLGRVKYLEWKGFDASAAQRDFQIAYDSRAGADRGAPILSLNGGRNNAPLISGCNAPMTGFGT